jgi:hypothetical protein
MWLTTPDGIENILWEGTLAPATEAAVEALGRDFARRGVQADAKKASAHLDILTIGKPDTWKVTDFYRPGTMPYPMQSKLAEADFYAVRLACSFRIKPKEVEVAWARFVVRLLADDEGRQPVAFDLHPLMVTQDIKHSVKVTLSPTLKFQQLEADAGGAEFGWQYTELQAIISAAGGSEAEASWDYSTTKGVSTVQGLKWMHMLVKAPRGMPQGEVALDLSADLKVRGGDLPVLFPRKGSAEPLTAKLWG